MEGWDPSNLPIFQPSNAYEDPKYKFDIETCLMLRQTIRF